MGEEKRLLRRLGSWTFRVRVPNDVRHVVGKKEIWKSFGDVPRREAQRLARTESVSADALFARARAAIRDAPAAPSPSDEALASFSRRYLAELERNAPAVPFTSQERLERAEAAAEEALNIGRTIEDPGLQAIARRAARGAGLAISPTLDAAHEAALRDAQATGRRIQPRHSKANGSAGSVQRVAIPESAGADLLRVTEAIQRALVEHLGREVDRASMQPEVRGDPLFVGVDRNTPAIVTSTEETSSLALSAAVKAYLGGVSRAHLAPASRASYAAKLAVVVELIGAEKPVAHVVRADVREARDVLLRLPPNSAKRWPGVPLRKVVERAERESLPPMASKTAMLHIEAMSSLFRWLYVEELAPRNPAQGIGGPVVPDETDRRPFNISELNQLFASSRFDGSGGRGWLFWLPRLALFTGARFAELIGLKASDVVEIEGVRCLAIEPNHLRTLKTAGSRRVIPVHEELNRIGFLRYASGQPADGLLFPDAAGPKDMIRARNKRMSAAIRAVVPHQDVVFHSLRHTFKDAADAIMPRETVARLGGWEPPGGRSAMDSYGRAALARKLYDELNRVSFPGLHMGP